MSRLVTMFNWLSTIRQYIRGAWDILGQIPADDPRDDFERLGWKSDFQVDDTDHSHSYWHRD